MTHLLTAAFQTVGDIQARQEEEKALSEKWDRAFSHAAPRGWCWHRCDVHCRCNEPCEADDA